MFFHVHDPCAAQEQLALAPSPGKQSATKAKRVMQINCCNQLQRIIAQMGIGCHTVLRFTLGFCKGHPPHVLILKYLCIVKIMYVTIEREVIVNSAYALQTKHLIIQDGVVLPVAYSY